MILNIKKFAEWVYNLSRRLFNSTRYLIASAITFSAARLKEVWNTLEARLIASFQNLDLEELQTDEQPEQETKLTEETIVPNPTQPDELIRNLEEKSKEIPTYSSLDQELDKPQIDQNKLANSVILYQPKRSITPLVIKAIKKGYIGVVEILLSKQTFYNLDQLVVAYSEYMSETANIKGNTEETTIRMQKILLNRVREIERAMESESTGVVEVYNCLAFMQAIIMRNREMQEEFLKAGAYFNSYTYLILINQNKGKNFFTIMEPWIKTAQRLGKNLNDVFPGIIPYTCFTSNTTSAKLKLLLNDITKLIKLGFDVNSKFNGKTALCHIVDMKLNLVYSTQSEYGRDEENFQLELIKLLLQNKANANIPDNEDFTPLMTAARQGSIRIVRSLIELGANIYAYKLMNETALTEAVRGNHKAVVEMLTKEHNKQIQSKDKSHLSYVDDRQQRHLKDVITVAVTSSNIQIVDVLHALIKGGMILDVDDCQLLRETYGQAYWNIIGKLVENLKEDEVSHLKVVAESLMHHIISQDLGGYPTGVQGQTFRELIKQLIDLVGVDNCKDLLIIAASRCKPVIVECLLERKVDVDHDALFGTALQRAISAETDTREGKENKLKIVDLLLKYNANPYYRNKNECTHSVWMRAVSDSEVVELLLGHRADPSVKDRVGKTVLNHVNEQIESQETILESAQSKIRIATLLLETHAKPEKYPEFFPTDQYERTIQQSEKLLEELNKSKKLIKDRMKEVAAQNPQLQLPITVSNSHPTLDMENDMEWEQVAIGEEEEKLLSSDVNNGFVNLRRRHPTQHTYK